VSDNLQAERDLLKARVYYFQDRFRMEMLEALAQSAKIERGAIAKWLRVNYPKEPAVFSAAEALEATIAETPSASDTALELHKLLKSYPIKFMETL
jgi:hypothetical protein